MKKHGAKIELFDNIKKTFGGKKAGELRVSAVSRGVRPAIDRVSAAAHNASWFQVVGAKP